MDFKFLNFKQDIIQEALDQIKEKTILVFPTEKNTKLAIKCFQEKWEFSEHKFYSMEEFKRKCFLPDRPILSKLKRSLAFYNCLSDSDKRYFRINGYFDSASLFEQFFSFWKEYGDEMLGDINIQELGYQSNTPDEIINWQSLLFKHLRQIKEKYQKEIAKHNYTDKLFVFVKEKLNTDFVQSFNQIVFVNQFYYSNLEKEIIKHIDLKTDTHVWLIYQLNEAMIDRKTLRVSRFDLNDLLELKHNNESIHYYESQNQFSQLISTIDLIDRDQNINKIVDSEFYKGIYKDIVSDKYVDIGSQININTTNTYRFFTCWKELLQNTEENKTNIQTIYQLITTEIFSHYYQILPEQRSLTESLIDRGVRYLNINRLNNKKLTHDFNLINKANSYTRFKEFIKSIDTGLLNDKFLDKVLASFYETVAELDEIADENLIPKEISHPQSYLELFLANLATRSCQLIKTKKLSTRVSIDSLIDTRNMSCEDIIFLNVSEGILPTTKKQQFLFNENQRKLIGLKDYDDILDREKYYFYSQVLSAKNVHVFSIESEDSNTQSSSFVEEIKIHMSDNFKIEKSIADTKIYQDYLSYSARKDSVLKQASPDVEHLEFEKTDLNEQKFQLSFSSLNNILNCSYRFYLENLVRLKVHKREKTEDIDMNVLGTIIHEAFELVSGEIKKALDSNQYSSFADIMKIQGKNTIKFVQQTIKKFSDSIPNRYQKRFMTEILIPIVSDSINDFFKEVLDKKIKIENIMSFIPENSSSDEYEKTGLKVTADIKIKSRADLRIETKDNKVYVVDYKTGKTNDPKQLDLYELFYYRLRDDLDDKKSIERAFYNVMDMSYVSIDKRALTKENIVDAVDKILSGKIYERAKNRSFCIYCNYKEICGKS